MATPVIERLKALLQPHDWSILVKSLQPCSVLWGYLNDPANLSAAIDFAGGDLTRWSPAQLALHTLTGKNPPRGSLTATGSVPDKILRESLSILENSLDSETPAPNQSSDFRQAALLALGIHTALTRGQELTTFAAEASSKPTALWSVVFAILYGLESNPGALLVKWLDFATTREQEELAFSAIRFQPIADQTKIEQVTEVLGNFSHARQLSLLERLSSRWESVVSRAASHLADAALASPSTNDTDEVANSIYIADLLHHAQRYHEALPLIDRAWQISRDIQAGLASRIAEAASFANQQETASLALAQIEQIGPQLIASSASQKAARLNTGQLHPEDLVAAGDRRDLENDSPATLIASAGRLVEQSRLGDAGELAEEAATIILSGELQQVNILPFHLHSLARILFVSGNLGRSNEINARLLALDSSNIPARGLQAELDLSSGNQGVALESALNFVAHAPEDLRSSRLLAKAFGANHRWADSLEAWKSLVDVEHPVAADLSQAAAAALECGEPLLAARYCQRALTIAPGQVEGHHLLALALLQLGDESSAIEHLEEVFRLEPSHLDARIATIEMYIRSNQFDVALAQANDALEQTGGDYHVRILLGEILLQKANERPALHQLHQAHQALIAVEFSRLQRDIASGWVSRLAALLAEIGDGKNAAALLKRAVEQQPDNAELIRQLAKQLAQSGAGAEAVSLLEGLAVRQPADRELLILLLEAQLLSGPRVSEAEATLSKIKSLEPGWFELPIFEAELLLRKDKFPAAFKHFEKLLSQESYRSSSHCPRIILGLSQAALSIGKPEVALTILKEYPEIASGSLAGLKIQVEALVHAGLEKDTKSYLQEIAARFPRDPNALIWAADKAGELGDNKLQIEILKGGADQPICSVGVTAALGKAYVESGELARGKSVLLGLFNHQDLDNQSIREAANILFDMGDIAASLDYLYKGLKFSKNQSTTVLTGLVEINTRAGDLTAALAASEQLVNLQPDNIDFIVQKSELLATQGKPQSAILALQSALDKQPTSPKLHDALSGLLLESGEPAAAWRHIQEARSLDPGNERILARHALFADINCVPVNVDEVLETTTTQIDDRWELFKAELALNNGRDIIASRLITPLSHQLNGNSGFHAIQARLAHRMGQTEQAREHLEAAVASFAKSNPSMPSGRAAALRSLSTALLEIGEFDRAIPILEDACAIRPFEPINHLHLSQAIILRAERQHLCNALSIFSHAPGQDAIQDDAADRLRHSLQQAQLLAPPEGQPQLDHWFRRGAWSFEVATIEDVDLSGHLANADELAAGLAALRRSRLPTPSLQIPETQEFLSAHIQFVISKIQTDPAAALDEANALLSNADHNPELLALCALAARATGNPAVSLSHITDALAIWPDESRWRKMAGKLCGELGMWAQATHHLEQALASNQEDLELRLELAEAYLSDDAPGNSLRVLEDAVDANPEFPRLWQLLAESAFKAGDLDLAQKYAAQWTDISPTQPESLTLQAQLAFHKEDYKASLKFARSAQQQEDCPPAATGFAAKSLARLGRPEEALQELGKVLDTKDRPVHLLLEQADLIRQLEGEDAAFTFLNNQPDDVKDSPIILAARANGLAVRGKIAEAVELYQRALQAGAQSLTKAERSAIHLQLGALLRDSGQLDQSLHHLTQSVTIMPGLPTAHLELAETYRQRREPHLAIDTLRKAISITPNFTPAYARTGELLVESRNFAEAEIVLKKACALDPQNPEIRRQLGAVIAMNLVHRPQPTG